MFNLEKTLALLLRFLLLLLPFQTIWLIQEKFLNGSKWEYETLGFYATEGLLWAGAILFMIWYIKKSKLLTPNSKIKFSWTKDRLFLLPSLILITYHLLSTLWALDPSLAFQQARRVIAACLLTLLLCLGPLTFRQAAGWLIAGATLQSVFGIWQFLTQSTFAAKWLGLVVHPTWAAGTAVIASPDIGRWLRAYGAFPHPNIFGGYLVLSIILTSLLLLPTSDKEATGQRDKKKIFITYHLSLIVQTAALFFTFSRSAWLAFAIWIIGVLVHSIIHKNLESVSSNLSPITYYLSLFVILGIIFFPLLQTRLTGNSINEAQSTSERLAGYRQTLMLFKQNPWLGAGAGNYTVVMALQNTSLPGWQTQPVHSVPLLIITELGSAGGLLFILAITTFITYHLSLIKRHRQPYSWLIAPLLVLTLFDHYLYSSYIGLLLASTYLGLLLKLYQPHPPTIHQTSTALSTTYPRRPYF